MGKLPVDFRTALLTMRTGGEEGITLLHSVLKLPNTRMKCSGSRVEISQRKWGRSALDSALMLGALWGLRSVITTWPLEQGSRESKLALGLGLERAGGGKKEKLSRNRHTNFSWWLRSAGAYFHACSCLSQQVKLNLPMQTLPESTVCFARRSDVKGAKKSTHHHHWNSHTSCLHNHLVPRCSGNIWHVFSHKDK